MYVNVYLYVCVRAWVALQPGPAEYCWFDEPGCVAATQTASPMHLSFSRTLHRVLRERVRRLAGRADCRVLMGRHPHFDPMRKNLLRQPQTRGTLPFPYPWRANSQQLSEPRCGDMCFPSCMQAEDLVWNLFPHSFSSLTRKVPSARSPIFSLS